MKKMGYVEPADYFPPEVRKIFEDLGSNKEKKEKEERNAFYREQTEKLIEERLKKKSEKEANNP